MSFTPKFIYFDLDDTLLNHLQAEQHALWDIYQHFDLFSASDAEQLMDVYHEVNVEQWGLYGRAEVSKQELQRNRFELTLRKMGLDDTAFSEVGMQYMQFYQKHWQWVEGAEDAFQAIRNKYEVGILTNGFAETQKKKFKQFGLYDKADYLVISEDVGVMKPHPDVFEHATGLTGYMPQEILYVGDSYNSDVAGGSDFGWEVAWYTQNGDAEKQRKADFVFSNFNDLTDLLKV